MAIGKNCIFGFTKTTYMEFLKLCFYLIMLCFVLYEIMWLVTPERSSEESLAYSAYMDKYRNVPKEERPDDYNKKVMAKIHVVLYFFCFCIGLLSFQWVIFLSFLVLELLLFNPIIRLVKNRSFVIYVVLNFLNSLFGFCFGLFVIINAYHLKIDTFQIAKNIFSDYF